MENWKEALWATGIVITIAVIFNLLGQLTWFATFMKIFVYFILWVVVYIAFIEDKRS